MSHTRTLQTRHYRVEADIDSSASLPELAQRLSLLVSEATAFLAYHDPQVRIEMHPGQADRPVAEARLRVVTRVVSADIVDAALRLSALTCGLLTTRTNDT